MNSGEIRQYSIPVVLLLLFGLYTALFQNYRAYDVDNPWFLSFSYDSANQHIDTDQFMFAHFPGGQDGTHFFGKLAAVPQAFVLNRTRWTPRPAAMLAAVVITAALGLFCLFLRKSGFSRGFAVVFLVIAGVSEPLVYAANKFRFEPFAFLLLAAALCLAVFEWEFPALVLAFLTVEIEPAAAAVPIAVTLFLFLRCGFTWQRLGKVALAALIGLAVYIKLHPHAIAQMYQALRVAHRLPGAQAAMASDHSTPYAYFLSRKRHLPELLVFLAAAATLCFRRPALRDTYPLLISAALILFFVILPHGNPAYMLFLYPFLVLTALQAFYTPHRAPWLAAAALVFTLPQYGYLAYLNRGQGYSATDLQAVSQQISLLENRTGKPDRDISIFGDYSLWFAHPRNYHAVPDTAHALSSGDIFLCFDGQLQPRGLAAENLLPCGMIKEHVNVIEAADQSIQGHLLHFYISTSDANATQESRLSHR